MTDLLGSLITTSSGTGYQVGATAGEVIQQWPPRMSSVARCRRLVAAQHPGPCEVAQVPSEIGFDGRSFKGQAVCPGSRGSGVCSLLSSVIFAVSGVPSWPRGPRRARAMSSSESRSSSRAWRILAFSRTV
jgi:hypothetical protein